MAGPASKDTSPKAGPEDEKRASPLKLWTASLDRTNITRTVVFGDAESAGRAAKRMVGLADTNGHKIELCLDGKALTVRLPAVDGKPGEKERMVVKRLADPGCGAKADPSAKSA